MRGKSLTCRKCLRGPVSLDSGHNLCRGCFTECREQREEVWPFTCPISKARIQKRHLCLLKNKVPKMSAAKGDLCVKHKKEFNLLCKGDGILICSICQHILKHRQQGKATQENKGHLQIGFHRTQQLGRKRRGTKKHQPPRLIASKIQKKSSVTGASRVDEDLVQDIICPICKNFLTGLVTLTCGHNFCKCCINAFYKTREELCEELDELKCPVCRTKIQKGDHRPNWQLTNIVEKIKRCRLTAGSKNLCERHKEKLQLFCKDDEELVCVFCEHSSEHKQHSVVLTKQAAQEYQKIIQDHLPLEKEREKILIQKLQEQKSMECLTQLRVEKQKIEFAFEQMHDFLNEKQHRWLATLCELEKEMEKKQEENLTRLSEEISDLNNLITEMEAKLQQPPHEFLQDIKSTLSRCRMKTEHAGDTFPELEERLQICTQKNSALKDIMEEFDGSLERELSKERVSLDPDTAHISLVLSEDLKCVRHGKKKQYLPQGPDRFFLDPCVLGRERFASGRHWWEVEVEMQEEKDAEWAVGVVRESYRQGREINLNPIEGIWAVGKERHLVHGSLEKPLSQCFLWAFTSPEWTTLPRTCLPRKIQVSLDYENGNVKFFDAVGDEPFFNFSSASFFGEKIRPYFWVGYGVCMKC